jgi:hypothetical protein
MRYTVIVHPAKPLNRHQDKDEKKRRSVQKIPAAESFLQNLNRSLRLAKAMNQFRVFLPLSSNR